MYNDEAPVSVLAPLHPKCARAARPRRVELIFLFKFWNRQQTKFGTRLAASEGRDESRLEER